MANPTTNYGFVLPTPTDLVTDLPADFDVALQGVDTRLKALQPGTTLGDLAYSSATANTNTRLGVGSTGNVLTISGGVPVWAAPAAGGKVLQVITATTSTQASNATSTFADTNLTATITPTLITSKVLVLVVQQGIMKSAANAANQFNMRLMRGATSLGTFIDGELATGTTLQLKSHAALDYLDSPATTSATTYKTQFMSAANTATVYVQENNTGISTIMLLEIGA